MQHAIKRCYACDQIIKPKRPLEIVEIIPQEEMERRKMLEHLENDHPFLKDRY